MRNSNKEFIKMTNSSRLAKSVELSIHIQCTVIQVAEVKFCKISVIFFIKPRKIMLKIGQFLVGDACMLGN